MNRREQLGKLTSETCFDMLVIGGGATGSGVALDAASRGLKVLLAERHDFAEGTSSRSTKLVHGGVRYLEKAVTHLDRKQYSFVREGLFERGVLLKNAPHLTKKIEFVTPVYRWLELPYMFIGLKLYDLLSGRMHLGSSRLLSKRETLEKLPRLNGAHLKGGVLYFDGQFNDARMAVLIIRTAAEHGAVVLNHMDVTSLIKENGRVCGAVMKDGVTCAEHTVRAKCVVNAAGPFADGVRRMDDESAKPLLKTSSGIHIVLDRKFAPTGYGMMIPETDDGRVVFVLPWENHALIGTTDDPCGAEEHPAVTDGEIEYVLLQIDKYFRTAPRKTDILSAWSGIRPLVMDPHAKNTEEILREHYIELSPSGLLTITGGKWTSYRHMAQDTVDRAVEEFGFAAKPCITADLVISGGAGYEPDGYVKLMEQYGLDEDTAVHLHHAYGSLAGNVLESGPVTKLCEAHPYIEAEVSYAVRCEMAEHAVDFLIRRIPLGLLDTAAAKSAADRVIRIMAHILGWDSGRISAETELAAKRFGTAI